MRMERIWAMPNKWTFAIKPIDRLLRRRWARVFGLTRSRG